MKKIIASVILITVFFQVMSQGLMLVSPNGTSGFVSETVNPHSLQVKSVKISIQIQDQYAKTTIEQVFYNPTSSNLQGWFLFPVPKGAVLSDFSMDINGIQTPAELLDADNARKIYEDIVRKIQDPALLEYSEQGLFKVRIFPIEPKKEKKIIISYTEVLDKDNNTYTYLLPMTNKKYASQAIETFSLKAEIKSDSKIKTLYSPTHEVEIIRANGNNAIVGFEEEKFSPESDFKLYIGIANDKFGISLLTHKPNGATINQEGFFFLNISPGFPETKTNEIIQKDITFVLDVSGSMRDGKLEQAKKALNYCIENLNKGDRFEVIKFSTVAQSLFGELRTNNQANRTEAAGFISKLTPIGGTNIQQALTIACTQKSTPNRPYMIVFITDGKPTIGKTEEPELLKIIERNNQDNIRIFTFGIGNEINTHLLDKITAETNAFRSYIAPDEDIYKSISSFYQKVSSPVLTEVELIFENSVGVSEVYPYELHDIFKGQSITVFGKFAKAKNSKVILKGKINGENQQFTYNVKFSETPDNDFIPRLWATRKIGFLLDQIRLHGQEPELVEEVTLLAKTHGIITPYTSYLILEDEKVSINNNEIMSERGVFNNRFEDDEAFNMQTKEEYSNMNKKSGQGSVQTSGEIQNLSNAYNSVQVEQGKSRMVYRDVEGEEKNLATQVTNVQGRAVYQKGDKWLDYNFSQSKDEDVQKIQFGSDEYFKLLNNEPETAQFLALGKNVQFEYNTHLYEIYEKID